jgi:hypothetical protein
MGFDKQRRESVGGAAQSVSGVRRRDCFPLEQANIANLHRNIVPQSHTVVLKE